MPKDVKIKLWMKKIFPYAMLLIFTIALMIYFKQNTSLKNYVLEGKSNLINYYTQNLKPLFFKTEITNEDIFNFALHKNLPVDKDKNDLLQIETDSEKGNSFEIKPGVWKEGTNNIDKYVKYLSLGEGDISKLDSILTLYRDDLYTSILYNDSNTIAVSPKIYHLQKAIYADIFQFTEGLGGIGGTDEMNSIAELPESNYEKVINVMDEMSPNDFIVFAKDTVFKSNCEYDVVEFKERLWEVKGDLEKLKSKLKNINFNKEFKIADLPDEEHEKIKERLKYEIKKDAIKAYMPKSFSSKFSIPDLGKINFELDSSQVKSIGKSVSVKTDSLLNKLVISISGSIDNAVLSNFNFDFNIDDIDEIADESLGFLESSNLEDWSKFGLKVDSLARSFEFYFDDSLENFDYSKFKMDVKKFKKTLKQENLKLKSDTDN